MVDKPVDTTNPVEKVTSRSEELFYELNRYHEILDKLDTNIYEKKREIKSTKRERKLAKREVRKIENLIKKEDYSNDESRTRASVSDSKEEASR